MPLRIAQPAGSSALAIVGSRSISTDEMMFGRHDAHRRDQRQQRRGVALDHGDAVADAVAAHVLLGIFDRVRVQLDRDDARRAELRRGDRQHGASGAEVGDAIAGSNDVLQQHHDRSRRRVVAGPEGHPRVDDDRRRGIQIRPRARAA